MSKQWFKLKEGDESLPAALDKAISEIEESPEEQRRRNNLIADLEFFYGARLGSLHDVRIGGYEAGEIVPESIIYNVTYGIVSTVQNRICSFRPRADFVPSGGDFKMTMRAKDLRSSCDAWFKKDKVYEETAFALRSTLNSDGGVVKVYSDEKHVYARRFPSWEFLVSAAEGRYREPECMYHVRWVALDEALAEYGEEGREGSDESQVDVAIRAGVIDGYDRGFMYSSGKQLVRVADCYKRGPGGRHVIMVGRKVVRDTEWRHDGFPAIVKRFEKKEIGFWGVSAINFIRAAQAALNEEMEGMDEAHHLSSEQVWILDENDAEPKLNNARVRIHRTRAGSTPPQVVNPPAVSEERYRWIDELRKIVYEVLGVSQFVASGVKQPGVTSAIAIRESTELQSDRLALLSQMYEEMVVEVADWWRLLSEELPNKEEWTVMDRGRVRRVTFEPLGKDVFVQALPSSLFGQSIAGRMQKAMELVEKQWLQKPDAMRAIDVPDLAPITDLELADSYYMERIVDGILLENRYETPIEYLDPNLMVAYAKKRLFAALNSGVAYPLGHIQNLTKLIDAETARAKAAAAIAAPPPPAPGAPPAAGPAPGTSPAPAPMTGPGGPPPPAGPPQLQ